MTPLTPQEFVSHWRKVTVTERAGSQSHFNDLCALLGVEPPLKADPHGEWFAFEKGATKATGGHGWADVWLPLHPHHHLRDLPLPLAA
jgi:hypothetical protein